MIQIAEELLIGLADEPYRPDLSKLGIGAVLVVAADLDIIPACKNIEVAKIGLVDGPGNPISSYCAAALAVVALVARWRRVLVVCHGGSRSLAVAVIYSNLYARRSWADWLQLLAERVDDELPKVHGAHQTSFDAINWRAITTLAFEVTTR